jgi:hypothetical protein
MTKNGAGTRGPPPGGQPYEEAAANGTRTLTRRREISRSAGRPRRRDPYVNRYVKCNRLLRLLIQLTKRLMERMAS